MKAPILKTHKIGVLRDPLLHDHKFAIPKLQRNFVWDAGRAAKLLDSIYYQMPIGSLFLWAMDHKSANLIQQSTGVLPPFNPKNKTILFVIDGQQRLSVIYQAFKAERRENDAGREIDFGRICFVVKPDAETGDTRRIVHRKPIDKEYVPLSHILDPHWRKKMPSQAQWFLKLAEDCRNRFLNYPIPVVTVDSATIDEIAEVFMRLNSQGMKITSADRAVALMGRIDVRVMAEQIRHEIREMDFQLKTIDPILMGFGLVTEPPGPEGDPPKLEAMARRWSKRIESSEAGRKEFTNQWSRYKKAFFSAFNYLQNRFPVYDESYLPSLNMLATLSVFFFHHPGMPNARQAAEIRKWFWATGLAKRYSGAGYHRHLASDATLFEAIASGKRKFFKLDELLDPVVDIQAEEYQAGSARTRTFFCLLAHLKPRFLDNGEPVFQEGKAIGYPDQKQRHHIFPRAQLAAHLPARVYNSLCNICFLVARDHGPIGMRVPRNYLPDYFGGGRAQFKRVMKSHLIPVGEDSGVWEVGVVKGFKKFRQQRLKLICAEFERVAGMKLFRRN
jgi:hypothetical protein